MGENYMALKNLFVRDTRIILSWEERYAKLQLVYNDLVAPYKTIAEHWEHFESLKPYFKDENASYAIINPSQFTAVIDIVEKLQTEYGTNKKMCVLYDDKIKNIQALDSPPEGFTIKYSLSGSDLIRELPDHTIECDDGWTVWNQYIWHLPRLSEQKLQEFRRKKIGREELIKFLKEDLPLYQSAGQEIACDINIKEESACSIELGRIERDFVELTVKWSVPLDSIDPEFDVFGYVISDNTVYTGINPLEIESYCPNVTGKNSLSFNKIAKFLDEAYEKWYPWITGNTHQFESIHHWLKPPFHSFLKVDIKTQDNIGQAIGQPYILIGDECLSAYIVNEALSSDYYHLRAGWIKTSDLKSSVAERIINDPLAAMAPVALTCHQILHTGDRTLSDKWQDILFSEKYSWFESGTKANTASAHFHYLINQGLSGGISGGFEAFMAYGLPYLIEYLNQNSVKPLILLDSEYKSALNTIIENTPVLKSSEIECITYNHLTQATLRKHRLGIIIEPEGNLDYAPVANMLFSACEKNDLCLCYTRKKVKELKSDEKQSLSRLLRADSPDDLEYLIRNISESHSAPATTKFREDLRLPFTKLFYHEKTVTLN